METVKKIKKCEAKLNRLQSNYMADRLKQRKAETREKIQFGGLVKKAGLDKYPKSVLLGAMIKIKEDLEKEPNLEKLFSSIGESAFLNYGD